MRNCEPTTKVGDRTPRRPRRGFKRSETERGFTLVELLIVVTITPLIIGGLSFGLLSVLKLQSSVANRLSDTQDAQVVSSEFTSDIQAATYLTTQSQTSQQCGSSGASGYQLLALEWDQNPTTNNWEYVVSYMEEQVAGPSSTTWQMVRQYCYSPTGTAITSSTTPTSTTILSNDIPVAQPKPTVMQLPRVRQQLVGYRDRS